MTESAHSPIGASTMERWSVCPGSVRLSATCQKFDSEYAKDGRIAHEFAAEWLRTGVAPYIPDDEMADAVGKYVDIANGFYQPSHVQMGAVRGIEHRFDLSKIHPGMFGTSDYWVYWPWLRHLIVLDFKYGAGIFVQAVNNLQAQYYALGVVCNLRFPIETIEIGIVQPRLMPDGMPLRTWTISAIDLLDFKTVLKEAALRTEDPNAPLVPGEHCRFCPASATCPKLHEESMALAQREFSVVVPATGYDPMKLKRALDARDFLKAFIKNVDEFAYKELEAGREIPGYKLVEKRPTRKWLDDNIALGTLRAAGFSDAQLVVPPQIKSVAQVEASVPASHKKLIASLSVKTSSGHAVVPESDARPAVRLSPQQEFKVIPYDPFAE